MTTISALLRAHGRLTAPELARRLDVSVRTVHRDVAELGLRGLPVYAERGRGGGYRVLPGYRPPSSELTEDETLALFLPGAAHSADALGLAGAHRAAMAKLSAVLDEDRHRSATGLQERLLVVPSGWRDPVPAPPALREAFAAVTGDRVVALDYRPVRGRDGVRSVHPLGVVLAGQHWYLVCRRVPAGASPVTGAPEEHLRTYRLDRVAAITVSAQSFTRDPGERLDRLWGHARRSMVERPAVEVEIRCPADALPIVRPVVALSCPDVVERPPGSGHGTTTLIARYGHARAAAGFLAGLGDLCEVVRPEQVRREIERISRENLERYGVEPGRSPGSDQ